MIYDVIYDTIYAMNCDGILHYSFIIISYSTFFLIPLFVAPTKCTQWIEMDLIETEGAINEFSLVSVSDFAN